MTESLIGRISELLRNRQSAVASDTQTRISSLSDSVAAASGNTLSQFTTSAPAVDSTSATGALAAALHIVAGAHPALAPRWQEIAAETAQILNQAGWRDIKDGDELPFRAALAMRSVDQEKSAAVSQHLPTFKSLAEYNIENTRKWGPFKEGTAWTSARFLAHSAGEARALIGEKQLTPATRILVFAADLGRMDARTCAAMALDARFERLFHKVEIKKEGSTLSLDCVTPRGGRDGLSISLFVRVRDDSWLKRAQEAGIPLGNCQIQITLDEAMY